MADSPFLLQPHWRFSPRVPLPWFSATSLTSWSPRPAPLLAELVESFGRMQDFEPAKIAYGIGSRENQTRPNVLRAILGKSHAAATHDWETDTITVLETNLDDINPEILGDFVENALASGALHVFHTSILMKKNRPGV